MPFFSIVIPIYKTQCYLEQCIESVLNQNFDDFEIILVDDGSPDDCPAICDNYVEKDSRVKVIHKNNGGLSSARNAGTEIAKGMYLIYLDSDDYWEKAQALTLLKEAAINASKDEKVADIILFRCKDLNMDTGTLRTSRGEYDLKCLELCSAEYTLDYLVKNNLFPGSAWLVAVKRSLLVDNAISFINGIKSEDIDWLLNIFSCANQYAAVNEPFYIYRKNRSGSITNLSGCKNINDILDTVSRWKEKLNDSKYIKIRKPLFDMLGYYYFTALIISGRLNRLDYKEIEKKLVDNSHLLKYGSNKKVKMTSNLKKIIGLRLTGKILNALFVLRGELR